MPSPISPASYIIHHIDDPNGSTVWVAQNSDRSPLYKRPSPRSACAATVTPFLILSFCRFSSPVLRTRCRDFSLDETLLLLFIGAGCLRARLVAVASARRSTVRSVMHYSWNRNNWNCEWEWEWDGFWTRSRLQSLVWRVALPGYVCRVIGRDPFLPLSPWRGDAIVEPPETRPRFRVQGQCRFQDTLWAIHWHRFDLS